MSATQCGGSLAWGDSFNQCETCGAKFKPHDPAKNPKERMLADGRVPEHKPCKLPNARQYLWAGGKGRLLVHMDFSQLELRTRAFLARDTVLELHLATGDVYSNNAIEWFGLDVSQKPPGVELKNWVKPSARKTSKVGHLGSQYWADWQTLYKVMLREDPAATPDLAKRINAKFKSTYYLTRIWWNRTFEETCLRCYSEEPYTGRRRYYPRMPERPESVNFPNQALAAAVANTSMLRIHKRLVENYGKRFVTFRTGGLEIPRYGFRAQVHDAFDIIVDEPDVGDVVKMLEAEAVPHVIDGRPYQFPIEVKVAEFLSDC